MSPYAVGWQVSSRRKQKEPFTGDSDFLALVTYLRAARKKVYIFSSRNNVSQELRTGADGYLDVLELSEDVWGKELKYRAEKEPKN